MADFMQDVVLTMAGIKEGNTSLPYLYIMIATRHKLIAQTHVNSHAAITVFYCSKPQ